MQKSAVTDRRYSRDQTYEMGSRHSCPLSNILRHALNLDRLACGVVHFNDGAV